MFAIHLNDKFQQKLWIVRTSYSTSDFRETTCSSSIKSLDFCLFPHSSLPLHLLPGDVSRLPNSLRIRCGIEPFGRNSDAVLCKLLTLPSTTPSCFRAKTPSVRISFFIVGHAFINSFCCSFPVTSSSCV